MVILILTVKLWNKNYKYKNICLVKFIIVINIVEVEII